MNPGYQQDLLMNLIPHLESWWGVIEVIVILIGLCFTVSGLIKLASRPGGERRKALVTLLAGILLLNAPELLDALAQTLFRHDSAQILSYRPPAHEAASYLRAVVLIVGLVGFIGVARGVYLLKLAPAEGGGLPRALVHIAGGILCINVIEFIQILAASLGGDVQAMVSAIVG